ncbi:MAG: zf-TFIIB domain-containing protein [Sphingomonas sp.]
MSQFVCPVDGATLVPMERQGIEIDHCPSCRGVWLDRGELDKIVERSASHAAAPAYVETRRDSGHYDDRHNRAYPHKKRKSFLEELFD